MYFPQFRVLNMAEDATHNMHNLYTIRGAEVRDAQSVVELHRRGDRDASATRPTC